MNFMEAYRILSYEHNFDCILFNCLNHGLDALCYESFALGKVEPSQVRYRLEQVFPTETIFTNTLEQYEIVDQGEPFFKK